MGPLVRVGIKLDSLAEPPKQAITSAAELGAQAIEFSATGELSPQRLSGTGRREIKQRAASHNLLISGVACATRYGFDVLDRIDERIQYTLEVLRLASQIHVPLVVHPVGPIPEERTDPRMLHFFDALDRIGHEAERVGVIFGIRTGWSSPESLRKLLVESNRPMLAAVLDPVALVVRGYPVDDAIRLLSTSMVGVYVKDALRSAMSVSGFRETPLGEGEIDWPAIIQWLCGVEYAGVYTIDSELAEKSKEHVAKAIRFLKAI